MTRQVTLIQNQEHDVMQDFIGALAQHLNIPAVNGDDRRPFFDRLLRKNQQGLPTPLKGEAGGLILANTTALLWTMTSLAFGGRHQLNLPHSPIQGCLRHMQYFGRRPKFSVGDLSAITNVLLVHSISAVPDIMLLAADIGRGWRKVRALGCDTQLSILLACQRWQEDNRGKQYAVTRQLTLGGQLFTPQYVRAAFNMSRVRRERLAKALGINLIPADPGETINEQLITEIVGELVELSRKRMGTALSESDRNNSLIQFLNHLAKTTGRKTSKELPLIPAEHIRYYVVQLLAQGGLFTEDKADPNFIPGSNILKSAAHTEGSFDTSHRFSLHELRCSPPTYGRLSTIYDDAYYLNGGSALAYNGLSGSVVESATPGSDLSQALGKFIPLGHNCQSHVEIATILERTNPLQLSRLVADLLSFLQLCHSRQPDVLNSSCRAAGFVGGIEALLMEVGGQQLVDGWLKSDHLPAGLSTRRHWVDALESLHPGNTHLRVEMPPHLWAMIQSEWSHKTCLSLAKMMIAIRYLYQCLTAHSGC